MVALDVLGGGDPGWRAGIANAASVGWANFLWRGVEYVFIVGTTITIGLFMIHLYMGLFAERGAFGSVIRGDVSITFAKRYHPGWYKETVGESTSPRK